MRLLLSLSARPGTVLPAHYNYPLSAAVYNLLRFGSNEFATYLHDIGYRLHGRTYKLFTFALRFEQMRFEANTIRLLSPRTDLYISSPLVEDFIHNVVLGTFNQQHIRIGQAEFTVDQIDTLPTPTFTSTMTFTLLSPLVLSTKRELNGKLRQYYLRPHDSEDINRVLTSNLATKHELLTGSSLPGAGLELEWDRRYLARHDRVTKRITIAETDRAIDVIGIQAPFTLHGTPELIRAGYECGFGEKGSMGFGMAKVL